MLTVDVLVFEGVGGWDRVQKNNTADECEDISRENARIKNTDVNSNAERTISRDSR